MQCKWSLNQTAVFLFTFFNINVGHYTYCMFYWLYYSIFMGIQSFPLLGNYNCYVNCFFNLSVYFFIKCENSNFCCCWGGNMTFLFWLHLWKRGPSQISSIRLLPCTVDHDCILCFFNVLPPFIPANCIFYTLKITFLLKKKILTLRWLHQKGGWRRQRTHKCESCYKCLMLKKEKCC